MTALGLAPSGALEEGRGVKHKGRLKRAAAATRSALERYPRELVESVRGIGGPRAEVTPIADMGAFEKGELSAVWIGHATVLLRMTGVEGKPVNVLTDPVFSQRIGMTIGPAKFPVTLGLPRLIAPALGIEHLPTIDVVLLSHAHYDHFDRPSLRALAMGPARGATVVTAKNTRRLIPRSPPVLTRRRVGEELADKAGGDFGRIVELDWNETVRIAGLDISAVRPAHWGARSAVDRHRRFNSYVLKGCGQSVLFAGDTAATDAFAGIGAMDLAIFGIGAYDPWKLAHANPAEVWEMFKGLRGRHATANGFGGRLLPMHHSTFKLGQEPLNQPLEWISELAEKDGGIAERLGCLRVGEVLSRCGGEVRVRGVGEK